MAGVRAVLCFFAESGYGLCVENGGSGATPRLVALRCIAFFACARCGCDCRESVIASSSCTMSWQYGNVVVLSN